MTKGGGKPAVLSIGRLYCDLIFTGLPRMPSLGTEVYAEGLGVHPGGGAFITAAHLAALGHPSGLAAMLPTPPFDDLLREEMALAGVDLSLCGRLPKDQGPQVTVAMATGGERAFLTRRAGPACPEVAAHDLARFGIKHVHVGELKTLVERPEILVLARAQRATVSLDCSWDDGLTAEHIRPLAGQVDLFLPNEAEMRHLGRLGLDRPFAPLTVVKRGSAGARAMQGDIVIDAPVQALHAVDTTGAGDAFNAGFLAAWLGGEDLRACLAAGNARGALAVQRRGGFHPEPAPASAVKAGTS